jgi:hypothetical protein
MDQRDVQRDATECTVCGRVWRLHRRVNPLVAGSSPTRFLRGARSPLDDTEITSTDSAARDAEVRVHRQCRTSRTFGLDLVRHRGSSAFRHVVSA